MATTCQGEVVCHPCKERSLTGLCFFCLAPVAPVYSVAVVVDVVNMTTVA